MTQGITLGYHRVPSGLPTLEMATKVMRILSRPRGLPGGIRIRWLPMYSHRHSPSKASKSLFRGARLCEPQQVTYFMVSKPC